jgi:hypothetical protein
MFSHPREDRKAGETAKTPHRFTAGRTPHQYVPAAALTPFSLGPRCMEHNSKTSTPARNSDAFVYPLRLN